MSKGANNLYPRFSLPVVPETGQITIPYRRFFSRILKRVGPPITPVSQYSSNAEFAVAINTILTELRAQLWLDRTSGAEDATVQLGSALTAITLIPAATEFGYEPSVYLESTAAYSLAVKGAGNLSLNDVEYYNYVCAPLNCYSFQLSGELEAVYGVPYIFRRYWDLGDFAYQDSLWTFPGAIYWEQADDFRANVASDWTLALNNLQDKAPNVQSVNLFAAFYGDDLRVGECKCRRKYIDTANPDYRISRLPDESAAYGGSPVFGIADAVSDLKERGYNVTVTPFMLMDIPYDNTLPDPYTGGTGQSAYPWRGRMTCHPAPGVSGSPDKTSVIADQVTAFMGTAIASEFVVTWLSEAGEVLEWAYTGDLANLTTYSFNVLRYAFESSHAGGVDTFVIGSEMRGLTRLRSARQEFPFVKALKALAAEVKIMLPDANIVYAADWSEVSGYQPPDGSGDLLFHLDELWADTNVDAIGIDWYVPLADWRDGETHLDYLAGHTSITSQTYLMSNIFGGEGYDWYYASSADRDAQIRTEIADGDYSEPWVWRYKDLRGWWQNTHYNRIAGVRQTTNTSWVPESKPIWFTEIGCPAVDKGANQPNVFVDQISSESQYPYYSNETRDDFGQRSYLLSLLRFFNENDSVFDEANNPRSSVYDGRMVDSSRIHVYTWDARPYPAFPDYTSIWADGPNWVTGHWVTGRIPTIPSIQEVFTMPLSAAVAPSNPYLIDPATGKINAQWREFFEAIGYYRGDAITNVSSEPTAEELATAINAIITLLRNQGRIG